jgi:hypothetical protein
MNENGKRQSDMVSALEIVSSYRLLQLKGNKHKNQITIEKLMRYLPTL